MLSCCGFSPPCSWEATCSRSCCETVIGDVKKEDRSEIVAELTRMDIALLREQYNWIKEKQKLQTQVVLFTEMSGQPLINVVPVNQEMKNTREMERLVSEAKIDIVGELDGNTWRTHLGVHRRKNIIIPTHPNPTVSSTNCSSFKSLSEHCAETSSEKILRDSDSAEMSTSNSISGSHKLSGLSVMSRRLSLGDHGPSPVLSSGLHYPFPKRKGPNKSEAARRLGMYASF
uniref:TBC1 domain-containing protein n=1 Tax=Esox lucius TaxID=8010 RepID=A0A3P9ACJ1_ESOLU